MTVRASLLHQFADPPRAAGMVPQWFWNDDLDEAELLRQLREFHAKGCGGVMPHARVGLSRRVGYLSPEFFRLLRVVVAEAARLGMKVVLYDEGSYPSGSAQGQVVAENPAWANRVLIAHRLRVAGPAAGYWRSNASRYLCDRLVGAVAGRETAPDVLDPESLRWLEPVGAELVRYDLPAGDWLLVAVWSVLSGATIRGVFEEEDDEHALAPPAADILNPAAVQSFIRLTHERYRQAVGEHFGDTITGIFIDEPGLCGRGARRGPKPKPYTDGFLDDLQGAWDDDVRRWLPALWVDCGPRTAAFRAAYEQALLSRQRRVFYAPISAWCDRHGIALTGHPPRSDEASAQRLFHWPGQDMVWWYVAPGNAQAMGGRQRSALEGEHSTAPKGAHSISLLDGRRFTTMEVLGAYGWHLTLDAVKWLFDWHLIRGINLFFPHAFFYSIRGRRSYESEPDLGPHNPWWPHWGLIADYVRRLCWLFTDAEEVCGAAIVCDLDCLPWQAAKVLYEAQVPFLYVGRDEVLGASVDGGCLRLGKAGVPVSVLIVDPPGVPDAACAAQFAAAAAVGVSVIRDWTADTLATRLAGALPRLPFWEGPSDLRLRLAKREGINLCLAVNEGEQEIDGILSLPGAAGVEVWDPLTGKAWQAPCTATTRGCQVALHIERRQGLVLTWDENPTAAGVAEPETEPVPAVSCVATLAAGWRVFDQDGAELSLPAPGDWARLPGQELFAGTRVYRTAFVLAAASSDVVAAVDLGQVGDIAEVVLNGVPLGVRAWAPYRFPVRGCLRAGPNHLEVRVTNSFANAAYGRQLPSGLLGPVHLLARSIQ